jgi:hypothetical protein
MSRGPTGRVRSMISNGGVTDDELPAADVEADLLERPCLGVEHVELARLRIADGLPSESNC